MSSRDIPLDPDQMRQRISKKSGPDFRSAAARKNTARAFETGAEIYDNIRPSYPAEVLADITAVRLAVDIGAGTGKFTTLLTAHPEIDDVYALDPSADMTRVLSRSLEIPVWRAMAEDTALKTNSVGLISVAQTWHWLDQQRAAKEFSRVLLPNGRLLLVWNSLDVSQAWVLRLSRIIHAGDVYREGFYPTVPEPFVLDHETRLRWFQELLAEDLFLLAQTRSYWLRAKEKTRARVRENLRWYLYDHLGYSPGDKVFLPYRTDSFVYRRS